MTTLQRQADLANGRPSGFDYLRISLSVTIIVWHTIVVCYGAGAERPFWAGPARPLLSFVIPSFFALSGFLVAGSLERNDLTSFLTLRLIRIAPALFCEVLISALVIGTALTTLAAMQYFSHPMFWSYLLNTVGHIHYHLPGVFDANPFTMVNAQLWTIPYELKCYVAIALLAVVGLTRRPAWFLAFLVAAQLLMMARMTFSLHDLSYSPRFPPPTEPPNGNVCVLAFLAGVAIHLLRDRLPATRTALAVALALGWATLAYAPAAYLAPLPVAYVTVWLGLRNPRRTFLVAGADYSYGMYLYGFPIQQAVYDMGAHAWYANLAPSLALSGAAAYLSWNLVEKPVSNARKAILRFTSGTRDSVARLGARTLGRTFPTVRDDRRGRGRPAEPVAPKPTAT